MAMIIILRTVISVVGGGAKNWELENIHVGHEIITGKKMAMIIILRTSISVVGGGAKNWKLEKVGMSRWRGDGAAGAGGEHSIVDKGGESELIRKKKQKYKIQ